MYSLWDSYDELIGQNLNSLFIRVRLVNQQLGIATPRQAKARTETGDGIRIKGT